MDYGELLYESNPKFYIPCPWYVILLWCGAIGWMAVELAPATMSWDIYLMFGLFIGFLSLIFHLSKLSNPNTSIYERGISQVKKKNEVIYRSYQEVILVECFQCVERQDNHRIYEDILVFWFADATYLTLKVKNKSETIPMIWRKLCSIQPALAQQLVCCVNDYHSQQLYAKLNGKTI